MTDEHIARKTFVNRLLQTCIEEFTHEANSHIPSVSPETAISYFAEPNSQESTLLAYVLILIKHSRNGFTDIGPMTKDQARRLGEILYEIQSNQIPDEPNTKT